MIPSQSSSIAFTWVRGGRWELFEETRLGLVLPGWDEYGTEPGATIQWGVRRQSATESALVRTLRPDHLGGKRWRRNLVDFAAMEEFSVAASGGPLSRDRVLGQIAEAWKASNGNWPGDSPAVLESVLALLDAIGPLSPLHTSPLWNQGDGPYVWLELDELWIEMVRLARANLLFDSNRAGSPKNAEFWPDIVSWSADALREVLVEPEEDGWGVTFRVIPRTLRCHLWARLFERFGSALQCRYCGVGIATTRIAGKPGRPSEYCNSHQGSTYREAVRRKRAPWQLRRLPDRQRQGGPKED